VLDRSANRELPESQSAVKKTLHVFSAMLGSFCGSLALLTNARAGVYIAGGIVPRFTEFFSKSEFRQRFEAKGRYQAFNKKNTHFCSNNRVSWLTWCCRVSQT